MSYTIEPQVIGPASSTTRPPAAVWAAAVLTVLLALVTSYGAIYFTFYFEDPDAGAGSWVFVTTFIGIAIAGAASAVAMLRGSRTGRRVLLVYGVLGILWSIAKLVFWQETEAAIFGVVNVAIIGLILTRKARSHVS